MNRAHRRWAVALCSALACVAGARCAAADSRRVVSVDPDDELARALEVALQPWGVTVAKVHIESPGPEMPLAAERARDIAHDSGADVLVWISNSEGGHALWIYDADSDHASARPLETSPPFEASTAAEVALAIKALLRWTVVAPPPERFGAVAREPVWAIGTTFGAAARLGGAAAAEARFGLHAALWPGALGRRWGASIDVEDGTGSRVQTNGFDGSLSDAVLRLALGLRAHIARGVEVEATAGPALHLTTLSGVLSADESRASVSRLDFGFDPRLGLGFSMLGGRLMFEPWLGVSLMGRWQRFLLQGVPVVETGPVSECAAVLVVLRAP